MKKVYILVPQSAVAEAVANPRYIFTTANQFLRSQGQPDGFDVQLVGMEEMVRVHDGYCNISVDVTIANSQKADLVIIPALFGDVEAAIEQNKPLIDWISYQHEQGAEIASLCLGAFLLAETGLLDGGPCSTHWAYYDLFRSRYPEVILQDGKIITDNDGIYTSGGANSYWNLLLYLLEKYTSREVAILASKYFAIDIDRDSQAAFTMFEGQKAHADEQIKSVQSFIEAHYANRFSVDELADTAAMSRRTFERRFKQATNNTVVEYIQRVKMEAAKRSLESGQKSVAEVMYGVGYGDDKAFRNVFKKVVGMTPGAYRARYRKVVA
ncbi:GlxA family transcriptional regulator [Marinoscillum furvescens]|uniref:AraC family transcriptional regulator with amidase-like domain n=1 Tax=Marinoscillum furvescens DSM 4134 TaxID=1122208 RepID=A0A3D9KZK7_MARFU|nr:helix-turn-helix domain-containing protein [Marinoscillum furvescens]RED95586.1 AraC family transcriptional regulator with amidase-like domain [Marinoscillum furvescens DSM 4134]